MSTDTCLCESVIVVPGRPRYTQLQVFWLEGFMPADVYLSKFCCTNVWQQQAKAAVSKMLILSYADFRDPGNAGDVWQVPKQHW